jgi:CRISPR-associated protein Cmr2
MYWQAKIWGLLHDPALKALHNRTGRGQEGAWKKLNCMQGWVSPKASSLKPSFYSTNWLKHVGLCDLIASASDRATLGRLPTMTAIDYDNEGLEIRHLLSGASQKLKLEQWHHRIDSERQNFLQGTEAVLLDNIKDWDDPRKVYWWLWRCYPEALANALGAERHESAIHLLPAETRLPDGSLWSHTTMTSALAGALAGYYQHDSNYPKKRERFIKSRPHIVTFTFTPVQELIKASRKMRDFWAGSWLLHYLSAKICWAIAWKYGPDTLLYPCLYEQPLIRPLAEFILCF